MELFQKLPKSVLQEHCLKLIGNSPMEPFLELGRIEQMELVRREMRIEFVEQKKLQIF